MRGDMSVRAPVPAAGGARWWSPCHGYKGMLKDGRLLRAGEGTARKEAGARQRQGKHSVVSCPQSGLPAEPSWEPGEPSLLREALAGPRERAAGAGTHHDAAAATRPACPRAAAAPRSGTGAPPPPYTGGGTGAPGRAAPPGQPRALA